MAAASRWGRGAGREGHRAAPPGAVAHAGGLVSEVLAPPGCRARERSSRLEVGQGPVRAEPCIRERLEKGAAAVGPSRQVGLLDQLAGASAPTTVIFTPLRPRSDRPVQGRNPSRSLESSPKKAALSTRAKLGDDGPLVDAEGEGELDARLSRRGTRPCSAPTVARPPSSRRRRLELGSGGSRSASGPSPRSPCPRP